MPEHRAGVRAEHKLSRIFHPFDARFFVRDVSGHAARAVTLAEITHGRSCCKTKFLTKRELARLCRCSERTIDRLLEEGDAPPVTRLSTRRIIFPTTSARQWRRKSDGSESRSERVESPEADAA